MAAKKTKTIRSSRLRNYLGTVKHETVLLGAVDRYVQALPNDRDQTVIHPSEMAQKDWCHRATWHRLRGDTAPAESLTLRSMLIFDEGHAIHAKWQNWLTGMGIIWGRWDCQSCGARTFRWADDLTWAGCDNPVGRHLWDYREVPLQDREYRISGHSDGIVRPAEGESVLLEIKSVGPGTLRHLDLLADTEADEDAPDKFSKITRPAAPHMVQTQIYMRLAEQWVPEVGAVDRAVVVYESKADQRVKEFVVTRNNRWTDYLWEAAGDIVWALDNDREVPCPHGGCAKCQAYEEGV